MFGFKPLLGLEPMAPIRPQLLVSHANHSATETSMYVCMYVCPSVRPPAYLPACLSVYVRTYIYTRTHDMHIFACLPLYISVSLSAFLPACPCTPVACLSVCISECQSNSFYECVGVWVCGCVSVGVVWDRFLTVRYNMWFWFILVGCFFTQ